MKKTLKIAGITLLSLLAIILLTLAIVCWLIFTPARLTSIARKAADKYILCESQIGKANLTLFKTFPNLGLTVSDVAIINPIEGAATDTVASFEELNASIDLMKLIKSHDIVVGGIDIRKGDIYIYTTAEGSTNTDIFPKSEKPNDKKPFDFNSLTLDIDHVSLHQVNASYVNRKDTLEASLEGLSANVQGSKQERTIQAKADAVAEMVRVEIDKASSMHLQLNKLALSGNAATATASPTSPLSPSKEVEEELKQRSSLWEKVKTDFSVSADSFTIEKETLTAISRRLKVTFNGSKDESLWEGTADIFFQAPLARLANESPINADADELTMNAKGKFNGKDIEITPLITSSDISFKQGKNLWLDHSDVSINADVLTDTILKHFNLTGGNLQLNQFKLDLDGDVQIVAPDTIEGDIRLKTNQWNIPKFISILPQHIKHTLSPIHFHKAEATLALNATGSLQKGTLHLREADGNLLVNQLDALIGDSIGIISPRLALTATTTQKRKTNKFTELLQGTLSSPSIDAYLKETGNISLSALTGTYGISDFMDKRRPFSALASLNLNSLNANLDSITAQLSKPHIDAMITKQTGKPYYEASLKADRLATANGTTLTASTQSLNINAKALRDDSKGNILSKWNPDVDIQINDGHASLHTLALPLDIPSISLHFTPGKFNIRQSNIHLGNSDFSLKGDITNLDAFMEQNGLLKADLAFNSDYTDITQLQNLVSGLGKKNDSKKPITEGNTDDSDESEPMKEANPFMVPTGANIALRTNIGTANWNGFQFHNIRGKVTCDDGTLVAEELGFTSEAATMQLTAMYKSPRKNHLYAGLDFHLMDIEIDELIRLIPKVDSIVPMLKSFDGQAQFHLAGETYMKSNYDLKLSTLRGAATVEGKDLVVLDNNTFSTIKKYLMTDRQAENKIDSMDVEISVFRDEVDVYPFKVRLGDYEAILGGRHNINKDFDFNYHISVTDCPLPVRLGLNIDGTLDDMNFKLTTPKYTNLYKPEKRGIVSARSLELKKAINESLKRSVKPNEYYSD